MTLNESGQQSVNNASGDDLASEIRAILTSIKTIGIQIVSDERIRAKRDTLARQNSEIIRNEYRMQSNELNDLQNKLRAADFKQRRIINVQEKLLAKQIQRMRSQAQRLSKLEIELVVKCPPPYTKVHEKLPEEKAKAKSRRKGGRCQIS